MLKALAAACLISESHLEQKQMIQNLM